MSNVLSYSFVTAAMRTGAARDPHCFVSYFSSHHPCVHDMNMKSERETGWGGRNSGLNIQQKLSFTKQNLTSLPIVYFVT